jgi:polyisoprenoid-binding protein YceI
MLKTLLFALGMLSTNAVASWHLDNSKSDLSFTSIKTSQIAENHYFNKIDGRINNEGKLQISIDLSTIESMIPIRNQRMQTMLFEIVKFPKAYVNADITAHLKSLKNGTQRLKDVKATLDLHGQQQTLTMDLIVNKHNEQLQVSPVRAILIEAASYDLTQGIEALRKVAGLNRIATTVPVTFSLVFNEHTE